MYAVIVKKKRDVVIVDLPGFFLQIEKTDKDLIILKLIGAIALLLVESNEKR